ncbi:MAG: pyridoxine 5'-phosphate synthase [Deltaproteobacteria bacterium]|nr:MAG: pyridoxine 5'-phosphate synthase [Deltaproteobacteria bacterium]
MIRLGVNIDHVATVRQARMIDEPDPVWAVVLAELGGADQITIHLREDRRHIQDRDLVNVLEAAQVPVNLELAVTPEMVEIAADKRPHAVCMVPEKREEVTTEGGLDVIGNFDAVKAAAERLSDEGILVSLFVDPEVDQIEASLRAGAKAVELHTGAYAEKFGTKDANVELQRLITAAERAHEAGLQVHAGHGLNVRNLPPIVELPYLEELNIGHALIGRAIFIGLKAAVEEYKGIIARGGVTR